MSHARLLKNKFIKSGTLAGVGILVFAGLLTSMRSTPASTRAVEVGFTEVSPLGDVAGRIIPASCASNLHDAPLYNTACSSAANACGQTGAGAYQCYGATNESGNGNLSGTPACSAAVPPTAVSTAYTTSDAGTHSYLNLNNQWLSPTCPTGISSGPYTASHNPMFQMWPVVSSLSAANKYTYCYFGPGAQTGYLTKGLGQACRSMPNNCNQYNSGTTGCDGVTCSVGAPANPAGYGAACNSAANACGRTVNTVSATTVVADATYSYFYIYNNFRASCPTGPTSGPYTASQNPLWQAGNMGASWWITFCYYGPGAQAFTYPATTQCNGTCDAVAPSNPSGFGNACTSPANACGQTTPGTLTCSGGSDALSCSVASAPALPAGYGTACQSAPNSCGVTNSGTINCAGACSASAPANPATYGNACNSSANVCGRTVAGTLTCSGGSNTLSCSAAAPANPATYGTACQSAANACGVRNNGTLTCSGGSDTLSCSAAAPANPATYGNACNSSANVCGRTNAGTLTCSGGSNTLSCGASAPGNPATYGASCTSPANICGQTLSGTLTCSGGSDTLSCTSATAPPDSNCNLCGVNNPVSSTRQCESWETAASCSVDCTPIASCTILVKPKVIIVNNKARVTFTVSNAHTCTLRRYNNTVTVGNLQQSVVYNSAVGGSGITGVYTSPALTVKTVFALTCSNAVTASCISPSQIIRVVPPPKIREL